MNQKDSSRATYFVILAASLWALDALIRTPLTATIPPASIVLFEHIAGLFVLSPLFIRSLPILKRLTPKLWKDIVLVSLVSSVLGTLLFTQALAQSFATGDFISPLLLQKLQPVLVIALSYIFLKERITRSFMFYCVIAIFGSYLMSFGLTPPTHIASAKLTVVALSLGAAGCWGAGTIISKRILTTLNSKDATFVRFLVAVPLAFIASVILGQTYAPVALSTQQLLRFAAIAATTGAGALLIYYKGLAKTPAHIATIAELAFPLTSILIGVTPLNPYGQPQTLSAVQIAGIMLLIGAIVKISQEDRFKLPKTVSGVVISGAGDGKKLGFPTANIDVMSPIDLPYGVYACTLTLGKKTYPAVAHYGPRLVFGEQKPQFEVHIFNFSQSIYKKSVSVTVTTFIRGTKNFLSLEELTNQIQIDCEKAADSLEVTYGPGSAVKGGRSKTSTKASLRSKRLSKRQSGL